MRDHLLVLLRGVAFRAESRFSYGSSNRTAAEQLVALRGVRTHVLDAAAARGWNVTLLADVVVRRSEASLWKRLCADALGDSIARGHERRSVNHTGHTQSASLAHSFAWAARSAPDVWAARDVLLVIRVDMVLKMAVPVPPPQCAGAHSCIWLPFQSIPGCASKANVADTLLWVPTPMYASFYSYLNGSAHGKHNPPFGKRNYHSMHLTLPVQLFLPTVNADANTLKDENPLYTIIGRTRGNRTWPGLHEMGCAGDRSMNKSTSRGHGALYGAPWLPTGKSGPSVVGGLWRTSGHGGVWGGARARRGPDCDCEKWRRARRR